MSKNAEDSVPCKSDTSYLEVKVPLKYTLYGTHIKIRYSDGSIETATFFDLANQEMKGISEQPPIMEVKGPLNLSLFRTLEYSTSDLNKILEKILPDVYKQISKKGKKVK
ncbi:MAG: hypothetical protein JSV39_02505 [Candidatus Aenigmatarchaeota archaeon]|nr:MAG: hypothetical protein JSV39_02505 [Candidatus Aenigmarchaeota archaeon]